MIYVLPKIGASFKVRQLVRFTVDEKTLSARIAKVIRTKDKTCSYELDDAYLPRPAKRPYAESELTPILEVFFAPVARGFDLIVRNGMAPVRTLGVIAKVGKRWQATPTGSKDPLAESFASKKAAAMALIDRRRRATRSPNL
jgi:hypothetical protein